MLFRAKKRHVVKTLGAPVLAMNAEPVTVVTPEIREFAASMLESLRVFDGIGLAAPQAGRPLRLVVFDVPSQEDDADLLSQGEIELLPKMPLAVINPEIVSSGSELCEREEGCLSVPDIFANVVRPSRVVFRAMTLDGEPIECECGGLLARCIQHELDHLDGVLFVDRLSPAEHRRVDRALNRLLAFGKTHEFNRVVTK
ncbi:MAG: peptide deformylase [Victivallaceae bacterium]|nr:peptide deformylase [Victivallaceae bacterium]